MAIVERGDDGGLYVSAELLGDFPTHTAFEIKSEQNALVIRAIEQGEAFWRRSTTAERVKAIREWTEADRPPAPDLSLEMMSRDTIYE